MKQSVDLGRKTIKFGDKTFPSVVIIDISGNYRLKDGRPVTRISDTTFEYKPQ